MSGPVDALMCGQLARRDALRNIIHRDVRPRVRRKAITKADVASAVDEALDAVARELRYHKNDLPRWSAAMDFAIAVIAKHQGIANGQ